MSQEEEEREQEVIEDFGDAGSNEPQQEQAKEISPEELIKVNNQLGDQLIRVSAYTMFYNAADTLDENGDSTTSVASDGQSEWVRHKYTGYFSLKLKRSGEFSAVPRFLDHIVQRFPKSYDDKNHEIRLQSLFGGKIYRHHPHGRRQISAAIEDGTFEEHDLKKDTFTAALIPDDAHGVIYGDMLIPQLFELGKEKGRLPKNCALFENVNVDSTESEVTHTYLGKDGDQRVWQAFSPRGPFKPTSGTFASEDLKEHHYKIQKMIDELEFMQKRDQLDALRLQKEKLEMEKTAVRLQALEAEAAALAAYNKNKNKNQEEENIIDNSPWPIDSRRSPEENLKNIARELNNNNNSNNNDSSSTSSPQ
jgi:hypothetical protein